MTIRPFFRWYDLWVGAYWDRHARRLYICPLPMIGVWIQFGRLVYADSYTIQVTDVGKFADGDILDVVNPVTLERSGPVMVTKVRR